MSVESIPSRTPFSSISWFVNSGVGGGSYSAVFRRLTGDRLRTGGEIGRGGGGSGAVLPRELDGTGEERAGGRPPRFCRRCVGGTGSVFTGELDGTGVDGGPEMGERLRLALTRRRRALLA